MKILKENIEDLKVIQSGYPANSRGYEALRLAITVLTQVYEPSIHWVLGESGASGTINVAPDQAYVTLED
jgi:hypothetical protein